MLDDVRKALARNPEQAPLKGKRRASVALLFNPKAELLFIKRADRDGDPWSGHISLPGGHVESDESFESAARRETFEEIGLHVAEDQLLGVLDDRPTPAGRSMVVRPFVYLVDSFSNLQLEPNEVASTHILSLEALKQGSGRGSFSYPYEGQSWTLSKVDFDNVRLWGLTLGIIDSLLHRLDGGGTGLDRGRSSTCHRRTP